MNKLKSMPALAFLMLLGCQSSLEHNQKPTATDNISPGKYSNQKDLVKLLYKTEVAKKDRTLVHLSHTCNLTVNDQTLTVIDIRELVKGAVVARGVNQIIVLNSIGQLVNRVEYGKARPLFCEKNKLYLYGALIPDGLTHEGNVLHFINSGFDILVSNEDLNKKIKYPQ